MRPLSILHVVNVDKSNYYLENLAGFSDPLAVTHSFATLAPNDSDFVYSLAHHGKNVVGLGLLGRKNFPQAYRALGRLFYELTPDIVHTHLFDPSLIGLTVAKRQKRKTVLTRHHSDAIHEIATPFKRRFYLGLENYINRKADHIIAPSRMVWEFLVEREEVPAEKVSIIPYGQTTERFDAVTAEKIAAVRAELGMGGRLALVCVSRLFHRKGHKYLFEAYAAMKREGLTANIYLVGDGDYRTELEKTATELGIAENVRFLGWRADALTIMAAADVIVHPSLEDALSSAVIESIMLEKPIVATDISGARDSLGDGKYGKIVRPADSESFRIGLKEVVSDLEGARARALEGRDHLLNYMDAGRVAEEHAVVYRRLMEK